MTEDTGAKTPAATGFWAWWGPIESRLAWLYCLLRIIWLCGVAVFTLLLGMTVFILDDQGRDVLRMLVDPINTTRLALFSASVLFWSLSTWYTSRLLLRRRLPGFNLPETPSGPLREWMPRILGALPPAILSTAFALLDMPARPLAVGFSLATLLLFLSYCARRIVVRGTQVRRQPLSESLPWSTRVILIVALVLSFVLLFLFVAHPVGPARFLGAASILVLAGTSLMLFFSIVLTYLPAASGYPNLVLLVLLWGAFCSGFNDNHYIHIVPGVRAAPRLPADSAVRQDALKGAFRSWLEQAGQEAAGAPDAPAADRPYPVFIVAAAGGGIRAAYWTAAVLAHTVEHVGDAGLWRRHLFAMSGVSGGALGVSVHMVQLQQNPPVNRFLGPAEGMLGDDHIAPVLAFMLFPDLLQRFWIAPVRSFDRARALESSWEVSARRHLGARAFSAPFLDLWREKRRVLPALLLPSTRVETGQRVIVSSVPLSSDFVDAVDLLRPQPDSTRQSMDGITLAAAVHLSARFAYISPAARVAASGGGLWGRLVDGGYFENSGASTVADLLHAICPDWNKTGDETREVQRPGTKTVCSRGLPGALGRVVPIVLLIKNDPRAASLCDEVPQHDDPGMFFTEVKQPFDALLNTKDALARIAQRALVRQIEGHDRPSGDCADGCVLELSLSPRGTSDVVRAAALSHNQYNDPPLGWSLSQSSRAAMDHRFDDPDIQNQLECIANLAHGKACTTAQRCREPRPNPAGEVRSEPAVVWAGGRR